MCIHAVGMVGRTQGQYLSDGFATPSRTLSPVLREVAIPPVRRRDHGLKGAHSMEFQDKVLKCIDCGSDFVFTAGEQLFFHDKQFKNEPKRCKPCKAKRAAQPGRDLAPETTRRSKPAPIVPGAARRLPSPSSQPKADRCSAGNVSSKSAPLPRPESRQYNLPH